MFKPRKEDPISPTSIRLSVEPQIPTLKMIRAQFEEAVNKRGTVIELPWTTNIPGQQFLLMVKWDKQAEFPVWTLYEENNSQSTMHWSQTFPPSDLQLLYDVMAMSASKEAESKIPDSLKTNIASEPAQKLDGESAAPQTSSSSPMNYVHPSQDHRHTSNQSNTERVESTPPKASSPSETVKEPLNNPIPVFKVPDYVPSMPTQPAPEMPSPAAQPPVNAPVYIEQNTQPVPKFQTTSSTSFTQNVSASSNLSNSIPVDYGLIQKRQNILLGTLLVEAGLITEPSLEAALKLQELVRDEKMRSEQAIAALKRLHPMGASIDQYLNSSDFDKANSTENVSVPDDKRIFDRSNARQEVSAALDLLQKADLLTENDIKTARSVCSKYGGDIVQILSSSGKLLPAMYEATLISIALIKQNLMKVEQCIIALNYCARSRVSFDEALGELGWSNPRKPNKKT